MSQPVWKFVMNLGDQGDPIEYGGLFLYEDETGVYPPELEKLEEPREDDRCRECEDEPEDPEYELQRGANYGLRVYPGEYVVTSCDVDDGRVLAHHPDMLEARRLAAFRCLDDDAVRAERPDPEKLLSLLPPGGIAVTPPMPVSGPPSSTPGPDKARRQALAVFEMSTALDGDDPAYAEARARIEAAFAPSVVREREARAAHAAWERHVAEHERWTVYRVCLDRFKVVREYDVDDCRCEVSAPDTDEAFWRQHERLCPSRVVRRYLVDAAYEESWRKHGTPAQREPWFYDSLDGVASCMSTTKLALLRALCGRDPVKLALAWQAILDYHYPLRLSRSEVEERYQEVLRVR